MEQSQLVELIKTLSPEEKQDVLTFSTLSTVFGKKIKPQAATLLQICLEHDWHNPYLVFEKQQAYSKVFPGQVFVEGKLEKVMVEAHKTLRNYLLAQYYFREENEFHQSFDFAEIVRLRGFETRYRTYLFRLRKMQEEAAHEHTFFYHNQFLLEYAVHNDESLYNSKKGDLNIPSALDALDMHLYLNRLALLNVYLLQQKAANIEVPEAMQFRLDETVVPPRYLERSPAININHTIYWLLKKDAPDAADMQVLFDLLKRHESRLDDEALRSFYTYLRNICTLILNKDLDVKSEIDLVLFDLYADNLQRGFLHYEGKLHPSRYLAISRCAERVGKHEWARAFIEQYKNDIVNENETKDFYRLNLAHYFFITGQFDKCLDHIPATFTFVDYLLNSKRLEIKALFETNSDLLPFRLDAFKMFLSRTSQKLLPDTQRQKNMDFLNLLVQITTSIPGDQKRADKLIERIHEKKQASEWSWLLAKATALKNKR